MPKFHDEFFRKSTPDHDTLVALTLKNIERVFNIGCDEEDIPLSKLNYHLEVEKICKTENGFIIGYIDIYGIFSYSIYYIEDDKQQSEREVLRLVIECKPELKSWGGPLRQIKTYMDILKRDRLHRDSHVKGVFTTFSEVPEHYRNILQSEHVHVVTFSRDGAVSGPVQSRLGVASK